MKTHLSVDDLNKLREAHEGVRGTNEYQKYLMPNEWKRRRDNGEWSKWKFIGWYIPYSKDEAKIKRVRGKVYITTDDSYGYMERYEVTEEVDALLEIL